MNMCQLYLSLIVQFKTLSVNDLPLLLSLSV